MTPKNYKQHLTHQILLSVTLLLAAASCTQVTTDMPVQSSPPENEARTATPTESMQGFLRFPYISADAGNFSLQAGEQITITWIDAPKGANKYEIALLDQNDAMMQTIGMAQNEGGGVQASWQVPPELSGKLEGRAYFNTDQVVRSGCCTNVFSHSLPPEGICSLRTAGMMPQHLYAQRSGESQRTIGIAPGLYLEVLARSSEGWYRVRTLPGSSSAEGQTGPSTQGWLHSTAENELFGSCDQIPFEIIPDDLPQSEQGTQEPAG